MEHLYLSPHLDDAILSCGGLIYAQRQAAERVSVLTLCAGSPEQGALSTLAQEYESAWSKTGDGLARRRAENAGILSDWGVQSWESNTPDAIYRAAGEAFYYKTRTDLFREPHPRDASSLLPIWEARVKQLPVGVQSTLLYAPLGIGGHVDHEITRRLGQLMGEAGWQVWFYEDYPYLELEPDGVAAAQCRFGDRNWTSKITPINAQAKVEAVLGYRTQIERIFGNETELVHRVKGFTAETACAVNSTERVRRGLAPSGLRLRIWRRALGYHAHAERLWSWSR